MSESFFSLLCSYQKYLLRAESNFVSVTVFGPGKKGILLRNSPMLACLVGDIALGRVRSVAPLLLQIGGSTTLDESRSCWWEGGAGQAIRPPARLAAVPQML
jgi:hypothetical protein